MEWLLGLLAVAAAIALGILLYLLLKKRAAFSRSEERSRLMTETGFSTWCFEGGRWNLVEDQSAPGHVRGQPPTEPGEFEGHCVKVPSVPRPMG